MEIKQITLTVNPESRRMLMIGILTLIYLSNTKILTTDYTRRSTIWKKIGKEKGKLSAPCISTVKIGKERKADDGKENAENKKNKPTAKKQNKGAANKYKITENIKTLIG